MPTLKQINNDLFWRRLEAYKTALKDGKGIAATGLAVHIALGLDGVPKYYKKYVSAVFRETTRERV